jgi:hypothetical protein
VEDLQHINHVTQERGNPITSRQVSLGFMTGNKKKRFKNEVCYELWRKNELIIIIIIIINFIS